MHSEEGCDSIYKFYHLFISEFSVSTGKTAIKIILPVAFLVKFTLVAGGIKVWGSGSQLPQNQILHVNVETGSPLAVY